MTVVVVAFGADELLDACLAPLHGHFPVVVVDNASRADCRRISLARGATYLDAGANLGFAGGVNVALGSVEPGHDLLLLNPDALLEPDGIEKLSEHLRSSPGIACVAPAQVHPDTLASQRVAWPFPTPARRWIESIGLGRLNRSPDFLIGSALLISSAALRAVGPFDERYFLYCEETDWQRRASSLGWRSVLVPDVLAEHVGAGTSSNVVRREAYFHAAQEIYVRKWHGSYGWAAYRAASVVGDALRWLSGGRRRTPAAGRLRTYWEGPVRHRDRILDEGAR